MTKCEYAIFSSVWLTTAQRRAAWANSGKPEGQFRLEACRPWEACQPASQLHRTHTVVTYSLQTMLVAVWFTTNFGHCFLSKVGRHDGFSHESGIVPVYHSLFPAVPLSCLSAVSFRSYDIFTLTLAGLEMNRFKWFHYFFFKNSVTAQLNMDILLKQSEIHKLFLLTLYMCNYRVHM